MSIQINSPQRSNSIGQDGTMPTLSPLYKKRQRTISQSKGSPDKIKNSPDLFLETDTTEQQPTPKRRNTIKKLTDMIKTSTNFRTRVDIESVGLTDCIPTHVLDLAHEVVEEKFINESVMENDVDVLMKEIIPSSDAWKQSKSEKEMSTKFGKLLLKCFTHSIYIFEDETRCGRVKIPYTESDVVECRICVHAMEVTHCELLRCFVKYLKRLRDANENFMQMICRVMVCGGFVRTMSIDLLLRIGCFLDLCKNKEQDVFDLQSREPFYIVSGRTLVITHCSNEVMLQIVFSRINQFGQFLEDYIQFTPYIADFPTTFESFVKVLDQLEKDSKDMRVTKEWIAFGVNRYEKMIMTWLDIMGNAIREQCAYLFERVKAVLVRSTLMTQKFKGELTETLKKYAEPRTSLSKMSPYTNKHVESLFDQKRASIVRSRITLKNVEEINRIISTVKKAFFDMDKKVFAQQVILFDQTGLCQVMKYDMYLRNEEGSLERYIKGLRCFEDIMVDILCSEPKKEDVEKAIKVAKECYDENDFNIAFIIYSVLSRSSTTCAAIWEKVDKKYIQIYEKLQDTFSISKNHNNYRVLFEMRPFPKIPILSLWMHDVVNINEMDTFILPDKKYLNLAKIRSLSEFLKLINTAQLNKYEYVHNDEVIDSLMRLLRM
ncbi:hypothetical protein EIN_087640 [Entamoeba invadens IP1]|uniref:hypothetical protein n=1 Tax=Entamoeba invadens IP1 TaxID=370355 RepID=UPI0002C3EEB9|nr:hypothetical protein EIN_087640 [Entamoeba invadens IP1]ELP85442.1 hypothetical protein EIN_087640 [Entamoeba invadens IP1]|eukprot:XP_004184788.1 hypothetical protein EIN_087640 [Entamoeba invadens IP1]